MGREVAENLLSAQPCRPALGSVAEEKSSAGSSTARVPARQGEPGRGGLQELSAGNGAASNLLLLTYTGTQSTCERFGKIGKIAQD